MSGLMDELEKGRPLLVTLERGAAGQRDMINLANQVAERAAPAYKQKADRLNRLVEQITSAVQMVLTSASTEDLPGLEPKMSEAQALISEMPQNDATVMLLKDDFEGYQSVVGFIAANAGDVLTSRLAGRRVQEEGDKLLSATQNLVNNYEGSTAGRITELCRVLLRRHGAAAVVVALQDISGRIEAPRTRGGTNQPQQPTGHSALDERTVGPGGRRPDHSRDSVGRHHRRDRRLGQLHHRRVAQAGIARDDGFASRWNGRRAKPVR